MKRDKISDPVQPLGMFAVMRHHSDMKAARFCALHTSRESALEEAQRLSVEKIGFYGGESDFCFYVVEIVGRVGIINGALQSQTA